MHCSDLERYLEACLEGRLGRARSAILRRHLAMCRPCRTRVESLTNFEADLRKRFREMAQQPSIWAGIEYDTVRIEIRSSESLPSEPPAVAPPRARHPLRLTEPMASIPAIAGPKETEEKPARRRQRWIGLGLSVAAISAALNWVAGGLWSHRGDVAETYRSYISGEKPLALHTTDAQYLQAWFTQEFGLDFPELPEPDRFRLLGGRIDMLEAGRTAVVAYASDGEPTLYYVTPLQVGELADTRLLDDLTYYKGETETGGAMELSARSWQDGPFRHALVSALPDEKLALFPD